MGEGETQGILPWERRRGGEMERKKKTTEALRHGEYLL
jgi:hypothetical protein